VLLNVKNVIPNFISKFVSPIPIVECMFKDVNKLELLGDGYCASVEQGARTGDFLF
jgi:hypothetical protein